MESFYDRARLATEAYADPTRLRARTSLYAHQQPALDWIGFLAGLLRDVPGPIADIGCGPGDLVHALRAQRPERAVLALDISPGMLGVAGRPAALADAMALPLGDGTCGGVTAMHMLYHVPEPEAALAEFARVRRPDGTVLVATNAAGDKRELRAVQAGAARDITGRELPGIAPAGRFTLEDGEVLARRHFGSVARIDQTSEIVLADAEPAVRHATSTWNWHGDASLPAAAIEDRMRELIRAAIDRHGAFRIGTHSGVLVCR